MGLFRRSKKAFGFTNINGKAITVKVTKQLRNEPPIFDVDAAKKTNRAIARVMNRAGKIALKVAKNPNHTPYLTGRLIASIRWVPARISDNGNVVRGLLAAGGTDVPYARRQELYHRTKKFFLFRAIAEHGQPYLHRKLQQKKFYETIWLGGIGFGD